MRLIAQLILALAASAAPAVSAASEVECGAAPEAVIGLDYVSRYSDEDASRATIDPRLEAEAEAAVAPVDAFILTLAEGVDLIYTSPVKDRRANAECVLDQLVEWADAEALSDLGTETVRLTVGSRHAAFALILWQTLPYAHDHPARERILAWLERRMREQMIFWEDAPEGARQGNLRAWAGLAAAALSVQTGDEELSRWAETAISDVMCSANADGSLPQEMSRGRLALHYQLHAVAPLVTAAALLERQGVPASRDCDGALHRIVDFAVSDIEDGARTRQITGIEQNFFDGSDRLQPFQLAWIEPYLALKHDENLAAMAEDLGPMTYSKLGGNQTALWGH